jgi:hypothetical protein
MTNFLSLSQPDLTGGGPDNFSFHCVIEPLTIPVNQTMITPGVEVCGGSIELLGHIQIGV